MSEPPNKEHPWEKFYAQRGENRPRAGETKREAKDQTTPGAPTRRGATSSAPRPGEPVQLSPELAAAVAAALEGVGGNSNPLFVPLAQKSAIARSNRRRLQRKIALLVLGVCAGIVALHFLVTRWFYRAPDAEALQEYAATLQTTLLPSYTSAAQPLQFDRATVELKETIDSSHFRYVASVTFRLREPLYAPALVNGTAAYRQMQESVRQAFALEAKLKLTTKLQAPPLPDLPLLIQVAHPAGEPVIVRVPFDARRFGWSWRLQPPLLAQRSVNRALRGETRAHFANTPHLVFGSSGTAAEMRDRIRVARNYVIAVTRAAQGRPELLAAQSTPARSAAGPRPAFDPNAVAFDPNALAFDPNALAVETPPPEKGALADRPAFDPNAPAIEAADAPANPDAPAVHFPGPTKPGSPALPAIDPNAPAIQAPVKKPALAAPRGR